MPLDGDDYELEKRLYPLVAPILALAISLVLWAGIIIGLAHVFRRFL
jgi:hypothetical protein